MKKPYQTESSARCVLPTISTVGGPGLIEVVSCVTLTAHRRKQCAHATAGTVFCLLISTFGAFFMGGVATLISKDYKFLGEWFSVSELYEEQKAAAAGNCWTVASAYGVLALISAAGMCYHSLKSKRS